MFRFHKNGFENERSERHFLEGLAETIDWCASKEREPVRASLRSLSEHSQWGVLSSPSSHVAGLSVARRRALKSLGAYKTSIESRVVSPGRLLAYFPEDELFDGCAEHYSEGFYDVNNAPPCDTWVVIAETPPPKSEGFLISWVPDLFLDLAQTGIDVNPEECICWLDDYEHPIVDALRKYDWCQISR